ncbi:MAG TPA: hypothetical protein VF570_04625 [Pyrinomonadaceae bacterium]
MILTYTSRPYRAVVPQRHKATPLGLGRRAHDRRVVIARPGEQRHGVGA